MQISNIPRNYLLGAILMVVVVLIAITAFNPGSLLYKDTTDYETQRKLAEQQAQQYQALLDSVAPNYEASQQLLEKIATEDIVREEVESALNVNQKIVIPTVATSELAIAPRGDRAEVVDYVSRLGSMINNYNDEARPGLVQTFSDSADIDMIDGAANYT